MSKKKLVDNWKEDKAPIKVVKTLFGDKKKSKDKKDK